MQVDEVSYGKLNLKSTALRKHLWQPLVHTRVRAAGAARARGSKKAIVAGLWKIFACGGIRAIYRSPIPLTEVSRACQVKTARSAALAQAGHRSTPPR